MRVREGVGRVGTAFGIAPALVFLAVGVALAAPPLQPATQVQKAPPVVTPAGLGAPVQVKPPCGAVLHNLPRDITFVWNPAPPANGYQVEVDCFDCRQVGHWDSEVGPPQFVSTAGATTATFTFPGDNKGRWRVRGTQTASAPGMSAIQAGPWSPWCEFSYKTGGTLGEPPKGMPDITSQKGITIGGAVGGAGGKFVPWGGSVVLSEGDALHGSPNSECAFNLSYDMVNLYQVETGATKFLNRIKADSKIVSIQSALSLGKGEHRQINTQAYLPIGHHTLSLWLDNDNNVAEMPPNGESNNVFRITYDLQGKCFEAYNPKP
jgi:hypothetical protein